MATLALAAVGSAAFPALLGVTAETIVFSGITAGALGAGLFGTAGGILDSLFVFPQIFGRTPFDGGVRLDDMGLSRGSEGSPIWHCEGVFRVPCSYIWLSEVDVVEREQDSGGKGGGGSSSTTTYTWYQSMALLMCEGEIEEVLEIWADSRKLFSTPKAINITDDAVWFRRGTEGLIKETITADSRDNGLDFLDYEWQPGGLVTVDGSNEPENNGTFELHQVTSLEHNNTHQRLAWATTPSSGSFRLTVEGKTTAPIQWNAAASTIRDAIEDLDNVDEVEMESATGNLGTGWVTVKFKGVWKGRPVALMTVSENTTGHTLDVTMLQEGWRKSRIKLLNTNARNDDPPYAGPITISHTPEGQSEGKMDDLVIYTGTMTQEPSSIIEAHEGQGWVPAYRGYAYFVIDRLNLTKEFSNRPPQFSALIRKSTPLPTTGAYIGRMLELHGLEASEYDTSACTHELAGYGHAGPQSGVHKIEPIMQGYSIGVRESNGQLIFYPVGSESIVEIDTDDLAARSVGGSDKVPPKLQWEDVDTRELPGRIIVRYYDAEADYQKASEPYQINDFVTDATEEVDFPLVLTPQQAKALGATLLWDLHGLRRTCKFSLPPEYFVFEVGDILQITDENGTTRKLQFTSVTRGANWVVEIEAVEYERPLLSWDLEADGFDGRDGDGVYTPPPTELIIFDGPPLSDDQVNSLGVYAMICAANPSALWQGASLYYRRAGDITSPTLKEDLASEAKIGELESEIPASSNFYGWDVETEITFRLYHGTVSACTRDDVYNGTNWMLIRPHGVNGDEGVSIGEIIAFTTIVSVEELSDGMYQYTVKEILRGLLDTHEGARAGHTIGEQVVMLESTPMEFIDFNASARGEEQEWYGVASEGVLEDWPLNDQLVFNGNTVKCFAPVHLKASRDSGTGDWLLSWRRRTRYATRVFGDTPFPLETGTEEYKVKILDGVGGSVVNTYIATEESFTYSAAQQTTDFGAPQTSINFIIVQVDPIGGDGRESDEGNF